jgi:3-hydroxyisobutyrate dehydrogenase-like beta-hydroxyacid dehydrogenase
VRDSLPVGAIHMVMGTHGVGIVRALTAAHAAAGQTLVAAPVLGRPDAAASGQLGIVAAGPAEALQRCKPLFDVIGRRTFEAGASPDAATSIKLANNFMLGCAVQAMGEAYSLVRRFGVAPQVLHDVMTEGLFSAPAYKVYGRIMADEAYDNVGFTTRLALKDMSLVLAAGDMARVPLPSASLLRDRLLAAIAHGDADRDWAVLAREQARTAGLE